MDAAHFSQQQPLHPYNTGDTARYRAFVEQPAGKLNPPNKECVTLCADANTQLYLLENMLHMPGGAEPRSVQRLHAAPPPPGSCGALPVEKRPQAQPGDAGWLYRHPPAHAMLRKLQHAARLHNACWLQKPSGKSFQTRSQPPAGQKADQAGREADGQR